MIDREKVIKGLEHCKEGNSCYGCPYDIGSSKCIFSFHDDILALLKEQEIEVPWDGIRTSDIGGNEK